jgi:hypothetical protein
MQSFLLQLQKIIEMMPSTLQFLCSSVGCRDYGMMFAHLLYIHASTVCTCRIHIR